MYSSCLSFIGILLLFRASFAQSAPQHVYRDADEEELIDRIASLAGIIGPDALSKQQFSNYDLSQYGYMGGLNNNDEYLAEQNLANLPRKFAYTPDDIRFFLPADRFPTYTPEDKSGNQVNFNNPTLNQEFADYFDRHVQQKEQEKNPPSDHFYMKKDTEADKQAEEGHHFVAQPNHVMSNSHSVDSIPLYARPVEDTSFTSDIYYIAIVAGCSAAVVVGIVAAGICWYRIHERVKAAADVDYPAYGVTGPSKDVSPSGGDRKLVQSAHMYHYQHQKQQMAALQKSPLQGEQPGSAGSDVESEDDNEEGDYTVYECPGLAPAGDMEVKNPLYQDEPTPATPHQLPPKKDDEEKGEVEKSSASKEKVASGKEEKKK